MNRYRNPRVGWPSAFIVIVGWIILLFMPAGAWATVSLNLKPEVTVEKAEIRLHDIASVQGASPEAAEKLGATVVATAPLPGQTRFVDPEYIRIRLRQAGFDTDQMVFQGAADVRVTRLSTRLPADSIKAAVEAAIRSEMPWKHEDVSIAPIHLDDTLDLPTGRLTYQIVPNRNEDYLGRTLLAVHLFVDGEPVRRIWANTTISVMMDVVTVVRPLGKSQPVQPGDLAVERRDMKDLPADTIRRMDEVVGLRTTCVIYPKTVLQEGMVVSPPLVRRGDVVKIIARSESLTITATGRVKQQGAKNEIVHVQNTASNRVIAARVTGPGVVEVDF